MCRCSKSYRRRARSRRHHSSVHVDCLRRRRWRSSDSCKRLNGINLHPPNIHYYASHSTVGLLSPDVQEEGLYTRCLADYRRDIIYPARAKVVHTHLPPGVDALSPEAIPYLRDTIIASKASGTQIRVLLLCNPHNPLACAYPVESIAAYAVLAEEVSELHVELHEAVLMLITAV